MWKTVIATLAGPVVEFFDRRRERKHKEFTLEMNLKEAKALATIEKVRERQQADIDWEIESIKNSGWRPEYLTIITTVVLALVFIPATQPYISQGFESLERTPIWFQVIVLMVYSSAFGIRVFDAFKKLVRK